MKIINTLTNKGAMIKAELVDYIEATFSITHNKVMAEFRRLKTDEKLNDKKHNGGVQWVKLPEQEYPKKE